MQTAKTRARALVVCLFVCLSVTPPGVQAAPGAWLPGPNAILESTYSGTVDSPPDGSTVAANQSVSVPGWVLDRTADGWGGIDEVDVYDGLAGVGTFLGVASSAQSRPDVAQALGNPAWVNSGFTLTLPAGSLSTGAHTLTVYAHTPSKGWWWTQVSITIAPAPAPAASAAPPVNVIQSPRGITISRQDKYTIKGYALDPSATRDTSIDRVEVYLDELRGKSGSKSIGQAQLGVTRAEAADRYGSQFMTAGYQIDFKPTDFDPGQHHIYTYAHSSLTDTETIDTAGFNIGPKK